MKFEDKYTNESEKTKPENKDKIVLSNGEFIIAQLLNKISRRLK